MKQLCIACVAALLTFGCAKPTEPERPVSPTDDSAGESSRKGTLEDLLSKMDPGDARQLKEYLEKANSGPTSTPDSPEPPTTGPGDDESPRPWDPIVTLPKDKPDPPRPGPDTREPTPRDPIVKPPVPVPPVDPMDPGDIRLSALIERVEKIGRPTLDQQRLLETLKLIRANLRRGRAAVPEEFPNAGADPFYFAWRSTGNAFRSEDYGSALESGRRMLEILRGRNDLEIRHPVFATEIDGYGNYVPVKDNRIDRGRDCLLYFEVENFDHKETGDKWEVKLRLQLQVLDISGRNVKAFDFQPRPLISRRKVHDYYQTTRLRFPASLPRGDYILKIVVEDVHGDKTTEERLELTLQ